MSFKDTIPFQIRQEEATRIRTKYPDRIPCILENAKTSTLPKSDKKKFLIPDNLTMGQFIYVIRKRIKLSPDKAIFIFVNGNGNCEGDTLVSSSSNISIIYNKYKNEDGFLYFVMSDEQTFG